MAQFGTIRYYNERTGAGFIRPEDGEIPMPFRKEQLSAGDQPPKEGMRVRYDIATDSDGALEAVKLRKA